MNLEALRGRFIISNIVWRREADRQTGRQAVRIQGNKATKKGGRRRKNLLLCSWGRRVTGGDLHMHLDMSLPDLLTSGGSSSPSSSSAYLPASLCSKQQLAPLIESCSVLSDKLHPQDSEMSRGGRRREGKTQGEGRKSWLRTPSSLLLLWNQ